MGLSLGEKAELLASDAFQDAFAEFCEAVRNEDTEFAVGSIGDLHTFFADRGVRIPPEDQIGIEFSGDDVHAEIAQAAEVYQPGCVKLPGGAGGCLCYRHCEDGGKKKSCTQICL